MHNEPFSQRHGLAPQDVPITIRHEAPDWLRDFIVTAAQDVGVGVNELREILCARLLESPDYRGNWSPGNVEREVRDLLSNAEWFHVYDFCEDIAGRMRRDHHALETFSRKVNEALIRKGVGWQLINGVVETRGEESFETSIRSAISTANELRKPVAAKELHEALQDLSKRPNPDISGAIQHSMAALECVARDLTSDVNLTLGQLLRKYPGILQPPLDDALSKIWGFASDRARHLRENEPPIYEDAELLAGLSGTLCTYLLKKFPRS